VNLPAIAGAPVLALLALSEGSEHAGFLGLPNWLWQVLNLVLFLAVLLYFVARPTAAAFRKRQVQIEERRKEAERQRADVDRLSDEIRQRTSRLEQEIARIRREGVAEGEKARADLAVRADEEAERIRRDAEEQIGRRLAAAREELQRTAADLTASAATDLLAREITDEDRRRLVADGVSRLREGR
jgi:F0F1-type ATP synthase membrane subunit b/b'